jgi:beta-N-acetylhexosaminidase
VECQLLREGFLQVLSEAVQEPEVRSATADARGYAMSGTNRDLVGQSLMLKIAGQSATDETRALLAATRASGVILFAANVSGPEQLYLLCSGLQAQAAELGLPPLLIAIDQEGGVVSRLPLPFVVPPSQQALGATGDPDLAYQAAHLTGAQLRTHGVNMNFAPVLDVGNNALNPVAGTRVFGPSPQLVADCGLAALRGYADTHVIATLKHFPGKGDTMVDSHLGLPVANHDRIRLDAVELLPFRAAIAAGAPAIMTAHMVYTVLDDVPATLSSSILRGLLRRDLGFDGLIVSDALDMRAIADRYGAPHAGVLCKRAGVDLLLPLGDASNHVAVAEALHTALDSGKLEATVFTETAARLERVRERYKLGVATPAPAPITPEQTQLGVELARRCLGVEDPAGVLPLESTTELLVIDCLQPRFSNVEEAVARADLLRGLISKVLHRSRYLSLLPDDPRERWAEAVHAARSAPVTLLVSRNAFFVEDQARLAAELSEASPRLIHLAARSPNDVALTPGATHLMTYGDQPLGLLSAVDRLAGR